MVEMEGFGVLFSTFITLAIVPCSYAILEDVRQVFTRLRAQFTGRTKTEEAIGKPPGETAPLPEWSREELVTTVQEPLED